MALSDNGESHLNEIKDIGLILDEEDLGETDDYNVVFIRHAFSGINYFNERFQDILCSRQHK